MHFRSSLAALALTGLMCSSGFSQGYYQPAPRSQSLGLLGGLAGAGIGAAIGSDRGKTLPGALIGGAVGGLSGAAVGGSIDAEDARRQAYANAQQQHYHQQQRMRAVTVADVISMSQAGLADDTIIAHIQSGGMAQRLSAQDLIALKQRGVSDHVLGAMQRMPEAHAVQPMPAPRPVVVEQHHFHAPAYYGPPRFHHYHYPPPRAGFHLQIRR